MPLQAGAAGVQHLFHDRAQGLDLGLDPSLASEGKAHQSPSLGSRPDEAQLPRFSAFPQT